MALKDYGAIIAWGGNPWGQCDVPEPNFEFVAISGHGDDCLGLKTDGSIVAWGNDDYGQGNIPTPNSGYVAICSCGNHNLALRADGSVAAWGYNDHGESNAPSPNAGFVAVAGGAFHSLGLKLDGSIVAWGDNNHGQCDVPPPNAGFIAIEAGTYHNLGLKSDGSIVAWGWNDHGQCNVPSPNVGFIAVAGGYYHSLGLKSDGSIVAWGNNDYGQCEVPDPNAGFLSIAAGFRHSIGLKASNPVPVFLQVLAARRHGQQVVVSWRLYQVQESVAYNVWRSEPAGRHTKLTRDPLCGQDTHAFVDAAPPATSTEYWLQATALGSEEAWYGPAVVEAMPVPSLLKLHQNQPNPFNPMTTIRFDVPVGGRVRLEVYDVRGKLVRSLVDADLPLGSHEAVWDGKDASGRAMASGSYFARLHAGGKQLIMRMALVR